MDEEKTQPTKKPMKPAVVAVACLAAFALCFIGLVSFLDYITQTKSEDDVDIAQTVQTDQPFYVLLIGSDSRKGTALYTGKENEHAQVDQHSDIMTLMRVDPTTYAITLITVPRDTVIPGQKAKINDALLDNDPRKVVDAVAELTGVRADFYMMIGFTTFEKLIDAMGGVVVDVPKEITVSDPATGKNVTVSPGKQKLLNGSEALVLARARKEYGADQDAHRQVNVRAIERAIIQKALTYTNELDVERVLNALEDDVSTNIDLARTGVMMLDFMRHGDQVVIYDCTGPFDGDERKSDGLWVVDPDMKQWEEIIELANAGEDPSSVVKLPPLS